MAKSSAGSTLRQLPPPWECSERSVVTFLLMNREEARDPRVQPWILNGPFVPTSRTFLSTRGPLPSPIPIRQVENSLRDVKVRSGRRSPINGSKVFARKVWASYEDDEQQGRLQASSISFGSKCVQPCEFSPAPKGNTHSRRASIPESVLPNYLEC